MNCFDRYKKRMELYGGSIHDETIISSRQLLENTFKDDPSYINGIYIWEMDCKDYSNKEQLTIRLNNRVYSNAQGWVVSFQTLYDNEISVGDIIFDSNENMYLICTESMNVNNIHWKGKFTYCNWILKWQDKTTGKILSYPCYDINATQYTTGEKFKTVITVGSSKHKITLPIDENTIKIHTPQRFFLDLNIEQPSVFITTQVDTTSGIFKDKGVMYITIYETSYDADTDRIDLGVCDYVEPNIVQKNNKDLNDNKNKLLKNIDKSVIEYSSNIIKSGGDMQWFKGKFYDIYGEEIDDINCKWNIISNFSTSLDIIESDNRLNIGIDNDDYIDEEFKIVLTDIDNNYESSLIVKIESLW